MLSSKKHNIKMDPLLKGNNLRLHLGCGKDTIKGMINCDIQNIKGVDVVMDCGNLSKIKSNSVSVIFCNSFFEHLYIYQQDPFLRGCKRILNKKGVLIMLGIPDFDKISELYFKKADAVFPFEGTFDLYQAYRLIHGDYEEKGKESVPQMHKALFNKIALNALMNMCGFPELKVFNYKAPPEKYKLGIGVVAWKNKNSHQNKLVKALIEFKKYFNDFEHDVIS